MVGKKRRQQRKASGPATTRANTTAMEELLGPNLLTSKDRTVPTREALKGRSLVALYFSCAWHKKCRSFDPLLKQFYSQHGRNAKLEIVYMSSDSSISEFETYFDAMPWVALPVDREGGLRKANLANVLKVDKVPVLVVLDATTGHLVSDQGFADVERAMTRGGDGGDDDAVNDGEGSSKACRELLETWRATEPLPFHEAVLTGGQPPLGLRGMIWSVLKNKWFIIGLVLFMKYVKKN